MKIFLISIILIKLLFLSSIVESNGYYSENELVVELNAKNFNQFIYNNPNRISLVSFYLNWCPHCIQFSYIWKQLAKDIKHWQLVVRIASIDCALDENSQFCQNYGITRFPRIRLFGLNASPDDLGIHFKVKETMEEMRTELIDYLLTIQQKFVNNLNIFPISIASKNELFNILSDESTKTHLIFIEKEPSHLIAQIILDFCSYKYYLNFIRIVDSTGSLSDQLFGYYIRLPSLIQIHKNKSFEIVASANSDNQQVLRWEFGLKIKYLINKELTPEEVSSPKILNDTQPVSIKVKESAPYSLTDLYSTLRIILKKEVVRHKVLNATETQVLNNFFTIVLKYLPFDNENVKRFFKRMKIWFHNKNSSLKSENLLAAMKISDGYLPPVVQWTHCSGSRPHLRGYPCGLWVLFHVLTVEEYLKHQKNNSHEVLPLMRDFIINFFACDDCAKHFESISRNLESDLISPESSVLWLWRIHNQINHRTKGNPSEDPIAPKVQYPTQDKCVLCYKSNSEFNETKVFEFLLETFDKKKLRKSAEYFAEQRILNKNSAQSLARNPVLIILFINLIIFCC